MMTVPEVEVLYRRFGHVIFRRCRALLGREAEAMDAMQEVFIRALKYGRLFRREAKPLPWLFGIANHLCFDRRRRMARETGLDEGALAAPSTELGPEQRAVLLNLLERFDPVTREIVLCYHLEEMTTEEISAHVGLSRKTVGKKLARFRERTEELLAGRGGSS